MILNAGDFFVLRKLVKSYNINGDEIESVDLYRGMCFEVLLQSEPMLAAQCVFSEGNNNSEGYCFSFHKSDYDDLIPIPKQYVELLTNKSIRPYMKQKNNSMCNFKDQNFPSEPGMV